MKCVEFFFPGYWLLRVSQRRNNYPGGMSVEAWQALKCRYFLGRW